MEQQGDAPCVEPLGTRFWTLLVLGVGLVALTIWGACTTVMVFPAVEAQLWRVYLGLAVATIAAVYLYSDRWELLRDMPGIPLKVAVCLAILVMVYNVWMRALPAAWHLVTSEPAEMRVHVQPRHTFRITRFRGTCALLQEFRRSNGMCSLWGATDLMTFYPNEALNVTGRRSDVGFTWSSFERLGVPPRE